MCVEPGSPQEVAAAAPSAAPGPAVDPITLEPVDEVIITTLVDNSYDALLTGDERIARASFGVGSAADGSGHHHGGTARRARLRGTGDRSASDVNHDRTVRHRAFA
jgi:hypothetical protein